MFYFFRSLKKPQKPLSIIKLRPTSLKFPDVALVMYFFHVAVIDHGPVSTFPGVSPTVAFLFLLGLSPRGDR